MERLQQFLNLSDGDEGWDEIIDQNPEWKGPRPIVIFWISVFAIAAVGLFLLAQNRSV